MSDFNMPPGTSVNDIPGNRPEDLREETFWETVDERFLKEFDDGLAAKRFLENRSTDNEFDEMLYNYVNIARALEGQDAFEQGKQEMEMTEYEIEDQIREQGLMTEEELSKFDRARREILRQWKD